MCVGNSLTHQHAIRLINLPPLPACLQYLTFHHRAAYLAVFSVYFHGLCSFELLTAFLSHSTHGFTVQDFASTLTIILSILLIEKMTYISVVLSPLMINSETLYHFCSFHISIKREANLAFPLGPQLMRNIYIYFLK